MYRATLWLCAFLALCLTSALAQLGGGSLRIHVSYTNDRVAPQHLLVQLMSGPGTLPVGTAYTNDSGNVEFNVPGGWYHVVVSGDGIERTESSMFELVTRSGTQTEYMYVHRTGENATANAAGAMVDASDLKIPDGARKEFQKASDAIAHENWNKARDSLLKAISAYPQYAAAYNNLAIVYSRLNDPARQFECLRNALTINDRFAPAYLNMGELLIRQREYQAAQQSLTRAVALDPNNSKALMLLADAQLLNGQYEAAIASAKRAHDLPHDRLALTHYISARAYEHVNRPQDAITELQLFLREEPQGERANHMREELKQLQRQVR